MEYQGIPMKYLIVPMAFVIVTIVILLAAIERSRRERHRLELQKAILERVGSVKDLAEFLTTEQGARFLGTLAPTHFRPHHRGLRSVRAGIVLVTMGVFLMVAFHTFVAGPPGVPILERPLLLGIFLMIGAGLGMLLSAAVSFLIARRLGLGDERSGGLKKDDAV
jgi:hypothetical protein